MAPLPTYTLIIWRFGEAPHAVYPPSTDSDELMAAGGKISGQLNAALAGESLEYYATVIPTSVLPA